MGSACCDRTQGNHCVFLSHNKCGRELRAIASHQFIALPVSVRKSNEYAYVLRNAKSIQSSSCIRRFNIFTGDNIVFLRAHDLIYILPLMLMFCMKYFVIYQCMDLNYSEGHMMTRRHNAIFNTFTHRIENELLVSSDTNWLWYSVVMPFYSFEAIVWELIVLWFTYISPLGPLLLTWFNFNPSMDK